MPPRRNSATLGTNAGRIAIDRFHAMNRPFTEYDGHCAFAVSLGKKNVMGNERYSLIEGGRKYLFSNRVAKLLWRVVPGRKKKAEANWARA